MKIVLFGCGKIGKKALREFGKDKIAFFIDNNVYNIDVDGVRVISFNDFIKIEKMKDYVVYICTLQYISIEKQLKEKDIPYKIYRYVLEKIPKRSTIISHEKWGNYLIEKFNKEDMRILEIGSRNARESGNIQDNIKKRFTKAQYIGMDIYPGDNVDIVGDAHKLSSYFDNDMKFDLVLSTAVFEHLAMPWRVAEEIRKVLKVGGFVFIETHFAFSTHARPWDFFRFSDNALKVLFSREMGFETVDVGMDNPINAVFSEEACTYLQGKEIPSLYCHSEFLGKKVEEKEDFCWENINMNLLLEGSTYPSP